MEFPTTLLVYSINYVHCDTLGVTGPCVIHELFTVNKNSSVQAPWTFVYNTKYGDEGRITTVVLSTDHLRILKEKGRRQSRSGSDCV